MAGGGWAGGEPAGAGPREWSRVSAADVTGGEVLVVRTLDPRLAPVLPKVAGVVSETGSVLSHLAILAREQGVPVVVGMPEACRRFPAGTMVAIDGGTGEVRGVP